MINYYILDVETTGLKAGYNEITDISIIRCADKLQFQTLVIPMFPERLSLKAGEITGKSIEDLSNGLEKEEAVRKCNDFFKQDNSEAKARCIVGHNVYKFDRVFVHKLWDSVGEIFPADLWLDTMEMSKKYHNDIGLKKAKYSLDAMTEEFGLKKYGSKVIDNRGIAREVHTAKNDTKKNFFLWKHLIEEKKYCALDFIHTSPHKNDCEESESEFEL